MPLGVLVQVMKLPLFQVDAFASEVFSGNPAAIVPLREWISADLMQLIATENQLSETAFYVPTKDGYDLRWFTPVTEVDLCGHATLAAAHVLFTEEGLAGEEVSFATRSGELAVERVETGYRMDFPADETRPLPERLAEVEKALGNPVQELLAGREDLVAVVESEEEVRKLDPDFRGIARLEERGILVTAPGREFDFVSRCFFPRFGIDEDPVTGSAHTTLAPLWTERLGKNPLRAAQVSERGGEIGCEVADDRVLLDGRAVTFLRGEICL
jgi:PhzF family phenazine biosynthesis protein